MNFCGSKAVAWFAYKISVSWFLNSCEPDDKLKDVRDKGTGKSGPCSKV